MHQNSLLIKTVIASFFFILSCWWSHGQSYQLFLETNNVDEKCVEAEQLTEVYNARNIDSIKVIGEQLLEFSNKKHNKKGINLSYLILGNYLIRVSKEREGMELLRKARTYYLGIEDYNKVTEILNEIGNGYNYLGNFQEACKWYEQSIKFGQLATEENFAFLAQINLAQALISLGKFDLAKKHAEDYRDWVLKLGALKSSSNAYAVLGDIELQQEHYPSAIYYFEQCFKFAKRASDNMGQSHAYTNIGIVKFLEGNFEESDQYFTDALNFRLKLNNIALICEGYLNVGGIKFEKGEYQEAIYNYKLGLDIAKQNERFNDAIDFLEALKEVYSKVDLEKIDDTNQELDRLKQKKQEFDSKILPQDVELARELRESERISKGGFVNNSNRWPFYTGAFVLFLGFLFLAFRRNID